MTITESKDKLKLLYKYRRITFKQYMKLYAELMAREAKDLKILAPASYDLEDVNSLVQFFGSPLDRP